MEGWGTFGGFSICFGHGGFGGVGGMEGSTCAVKADGGDGESEASGLEERFGELDAFVRACFGEAMN